MFFRSRRYSGGNSEKNSGSGSAGGVLHSAFHSTSSSGNGAVNTSGGGGGAAASRESGRFRYERPNSAPLPSSSASLSLSQSPSPSPPPATLLGQQSPAAVAAGSSPTSSTTAPLLLASGGAQSQSVFRPQDVSDVSLVEQRLKIIKRNRASSAAKTLPNSSGSPEYTELPSPSKVGAVRLAKHEQHVVDAMVTECLDALLFPSALFVDGEP